MYICNSLNKNGYSNFSLTILEYCEPDKCLIRERHYWDIFNPEYNIAKDPTAPMSGRKHSDKTKTILSDANKGDNHPNYGQTLSDDTKTIMSEAKKGEKNPMFGKNHTEETKTIMSDSQKKSDNSGRFKPGQPRLEGAGKASQAIEVSDIKNNITITYDSISEAAKALNIQNAIIVKYFARNQKKPYKGQYTFKKL